MFAGVDLGSTSTKAVLVDSGGAMLSNSIAFS